MFRQPAEWEPHAACWLAWPTHADLWKEALPEVQRVFVELVRAIVDVDPAGGVPRGESVELLVPGAKSEGPALAALRGVPCHVHRIPYGDIWLRDTAPVFVRDEDGTVTAASFKFNGWGGKYVLPHDDKVSARVATASGLPTWRFPFVLEGGSVEVDGEGTCLTTRQCLLNPNRNPSMDQAALEKALRESIGAEKTLWLGDGLLNDHTDGHVDTVARFVAPGAVVCMEPRDGDDPNRDALLTIARDLASFRDAAGRSLEVVRIPSPGRVVDGDGQVMPASYVNFYVGNRCVVVPTYGSPHDDEAVAVIARIFPGRRTIGLPAKELLEGGGAFHCISQQQPLETRQAGEWTSPGDAPATSHSPSPPARGAQTFPSGARRPAGG